MHRIIQRWLPIVLLAGLVLVGTSLAQPPAPKQGSSTTSAQPAPVSPVSVDDIVERIMAFDKNKDGKVTKDELPERMHHLIELGDTNKDGALDKDEIRNLATRLAATRGGFGPDAIQIAGSGPVAAGGFGGGGVIRGGPGPGPAAIEGVVEDLKLSGVKKEQAMAAVKAHEEKVRKLMEQARAELLEKMKDILSEEELKDFRAALDRPRSVTSVFVGGPRDAPEEGGRNKLDPPKK